MSRRIRLLVFSVGAAGLAVLFALAVEAMPRFGGSEHSYRDRAVSAAASHATANAVSSVSFDQRGLDTLGEEAVIFGAIIGVSVLLRPSRDESERSPAGGGRVLDVVALMSYLLLPVIIVVGLAVVVRGHVSPGGAFQGGVVLATGVHLLYLGSRYQSLRRLRPLGWYRWAEGLSTAGFVCLALAGLALNAGFLANVLPFGTVGELLSAGTVPILDLLVGAAVAGGVVVLLAHFLAQALEIEGSSPDDSAG